MAIEFLYPSELALMQADADAYVRDEQFAGTILYESFVSRGTIDPSTGRQIAVYAGTWIHAVRSLVTDMEVLSSESRYQVGDITYTVRATDIGIVKKEDRIRDLVYGEHYVKGYKTDVVRILHDIITRNLGNV